MIDEIIDWLVAAGLVAEGNVVGARRREKPPRLLTVRVYGSEVPERSFDTTIEGPRVQFEFREARYDLAAAWAQQVCDYIEEHGENLVLGGTQYPQIAPITAVIDLGDDPGGRPLAGFNARVERVSVTRT